ncbi:MAG: cytochrome c [Acidobacteriota bacterium]|nr:cytochrome c [Acidobacteriota bacterium]
MSQTKIVAGVVFCLLAACAGWAQDGGKEMYLDKCSVCHDPDGTGKTAKGKKLKVVDVHQTAAKESAADMIKIVTEGKGKNMDAFGKDLKADQIAAIVQYYRSLAK